METKICIKCKIEKEITEFYKNGIIYDTFDCHDRQVEDVWLVS